MQQPLIEYISRNASKSLHENSTDRDVILALIKESISLLSADNFLANVWPELEILRERADQFLASKTVAEPKVAKRQ